MNKLLKFLAENAESFLSANNCYFKKCTHVSLININLLTSMMIMILDYPQKSKKHN